MRLLLAGIIFAAVAATASAQTSSFTPLGTVSGDSFGTGVSAAGDAVSGKTGTQAFLWTGAGGMAGLGGNSFGRAISADGHVVVGTRIPGPLQSAAVTWVDGGAAVPLTDALGNAAYSAANGVSADGSIIVGFLVDANGIEAFRGGTMVGIGDLAGGAFDSEATAVSADGSVVVGFGTSASGREAFTWSSGAGMVGLGDLAGGTFDSVANAVSADGLVVVGDSDGASGTEAFRWTSGGGMAGLGDLPGGTFSSEADATSGDGSVVVGKGTTAAGQEAFLWTQTAGMQRLVDYLTTNGATGLANWTLTEANAISADGLWVAGSGVDPAGATEAFLANLTPADLTPDAFAFVDQADVARSTVITSAPVTLTGISAPAAVSVTGGTYSVGCTATFTSAAGTISDGETVCVRHTSAAAGSATVNTTLTVGGVSDTFSSTTAMASGGGGGGGGAIDGFSLLALGLLAWRRRITTRRRDSATL